MAGAIGRVSFLSRLLFPPRCAACRELLNWRAPFEKEKRGSAIENALCATCRDAWLEAERTECGICASSVRDCLCMPQDLRAARMHALFKAVYYVPKKRNTVQNRVVYHIKEEGERRTPYFLAERLSPGIAETLRRSKIPLEDCILTYLPRTSRAVRLHGIDQSERLARAIAQVLGIPMQPMLRRRRGANRVQKHLSAQDRMKNARRSFRAAKGAKAAVGKTVLLVDDVVTTGAGMAACTRILYSVGARRVLGIAVAVDDVNRDLCVMGRIRRDSWNNVFEKSRNGGTELEKQPEGGGYREENGRNA